VRGPAECVRPLTVQGAAVVDGGYAILTPKQAQWARRNGAEDIGSHPEDATLSELLTIGNARRAG
jgi:hypothetical protein